MLHVPALCVRIGDVLCNWGDVDGIELWDEQDGQKMIALTTGAMSIPPWQAPVETMVFITREPSRLGDTSTDVDNIQREQREQALEARRDELIEALESHVNGLQELIDDTGGAQPIRRCRVEGMLQAARDLIEWEGH